MDELEIGLTAIAAPFNNAHGDVVCSMSLDGPTFRLPAERVSEVTPIPAWKLLRRAVASPRLGVVLTRVRGKNIKKKKKKIFFK